MKLIFATVAGSHLYGTNRPDSDVDIRGVCIEPLEAILGLQKFEQQMYSTNEWALNAFGLDSDDVTIYGLRKFARLALDANPNIVELLFATNLVTTKYNRAWDAIIANRDAFLSTKIIYTFAGYAYSQLQRIKGHKKWIENPPIKPDPKQYGVSQEEAGGYTWADINQYNVYRGLLKDYQNYTTWRNERNPKRQVLEQEYGYDTKHAAHLVRLVGEAEELLLTGSLQLPLRKELLDKTLAVLHGEVDYDEIIRQGEDAKDYLHRLESVSNLPKTPDFNRIEQLVMSINYEASCQV